MGQPELVFSWITVLLNFVQSGASFPERTHCGRLTRNFSCWRAVSNRFITSKSAPVDFGGFLSYSVIMLYVDLSFRWSNLAQRLRYSALSRHREWKLKHVNQMSQGHSWSAGWSVGLLISAGSELRDRFQRKLQSH